MIDSHCHLTYPGVEGATPMDLVKHAEQAGVTGMLDIAVQLSDLPKRMEALSEAKNVWHTVGIHPCHVGEEAVAEDTLIRTLKTACDLQKVVGIGETGLDKHYPNNPELKDQIKSFEVHLETAQNIGFPVVIHSRDAEEETMEVLEKYLKKGALPAVIHCFTSSAYMASWALERGFYLGATGVITYKKSTDLQEIFTKISLNQLLIETDCPFLTPTPHRGKPNQPAYVPLVAEYLAKLRGVDVSEIINHTKHNFHKLFPKVLEVS